MGRISSYIVIALITVACMMGAGIYYSGASTISTANPDPNYPQNQTFAGSNFFSSLSGFIGTVGELGSALQRITPTQGPQYTDLTAFVDASLAIIKILLQVPLLIVSFLYDMMRLLFFFLPAQAPPEFLVMIGILVLIPVVYVLFEIAAAIRGTSIRAW